MRKCLFILLQLVFVVLAQAQMSGLGPLPALTAAQLKNVDNLIDSLRPLLVQTKDDTAKVNLLNILANAYQSQNKRDSCSKYLQDALELSKKLNYIRGLFDAQNRLAFLLDEAGNYPKALELTLANLPIAEQYKDTLRLFFTIRQLSGVYTNMKDFARQLTYARKLKQLALSGYIKKQSNAENLSQMSLLHLASAFAGLNQLDSALYYYQLFYKTAVYLKNNEGLALATANLGEASLKLGNLNEAQSYYQMAISYAKAAGRVDIIAGSYLGWAKIFQQKSQLDSALYYAGLSLNGFRQWQLPAYELEAASFLDELYTKENQMDSAHHYLALAVALKDSLFNQEKIRQIQNLQFTETLREQQVEQERKEAEQLYETKLKIYSLIAGLVVVLLLAYFLYRNNRQKRNANVVLHQKNEEIQNTLTELKVTQAQLIHSEKMASLGELTAGIAHEIQNPLNFVNNFSEVNKELIEELHEEQSKEPRNHQIESKILDDIDQNLEKVILHGKRADTIVKAMLQHSRSTSGIKELTDVNKLADEYLRLSYHGFKAKDKTFNATIQTDFDKTIHEINIVPQDIGRVLLNLFNNAFYAVTEKMNRQPDGYEPTVSVSTKKINHKVEIQVRDNGNGIPEKVLHKIFQPFFTTKPTGQGTGLGLSLAYDIIKAHGGEIKVETKEGQGAEFIVQLPAV